MDQWSRDLRREASETLVNPALSPRQPHWKKRTLRSSHKYLVLVYEGKEGVWSGLCMHKNRIVDYRGLPIAIIWFTIMMTKALTSYAYCEIYAANYMEPEIIRAPPPPPQPILLLYPLQCTDVKRIWWIIILSPSPSHSLPSWHHSVQPWGEHR